MPESRKQMTLAELIAESKRPRAVSKEIERRSIALARAHGSKPTKEAKRAYGSGG
jgi:hypothetical protein